jgi:hypothetical protein
MLSSQECKEKIEKNIYQNHRGDLCCAFEYHDGDGVLSDTAVLVKDSLRRAYHHITSRILAILPLPA